ncbi:MAG: maleylpyruvate isomerase N-terminal domain-containing protein [Acidimicrobiales bacterium]
MDYDRLIEGISDAREGIVGALRAGDLQATVPTCPDFTLDQLAKHIGEFSGFWAHVVCEALGQDKQDHGAEPGPEGRAGWVDAWIGHLIDVLHDATADTPCWTWNESDQSVGFAATRSCHELTIHRVDTQLAAGVPVDAIPADVATAGIEEVFTFVDRDFSFVDRWEHEPPAGSAPNGETLHLHGTDGDAAEWLLRLQPDGVEITREHAKADLALRGTVGDLELILYQRPTNGDVERFGDEAVLDLFHRLFTF